VRAVHFKFLAFLVLFSGTGWTADRIPPCFSGRNILLIDNDQVIRWKNNTQNQFEQRAHVAGNVVRIFPDRNGHDHFEIQIGRNPDDVLEVVYNQNFGSIPSVRLGMEVEACGDYITSIAQSGPYPPSPSGAIIHWVHFNTRGGGHDDGFVAIDGYLYGDMAPRAQPNNNGARGNRRGGSRFFVFDLFPELLAQ